MSRLVFRNANLVDGENPAVRGSSVVVEGDRITSVHPGEEAPVAAGPDDREIDLAGRTLMPGLFSCHVHTTFDSCGAIPAPSLGLEHPPAYTALLAGRNMGILLDHGVTSIICSSTAYSIDGSLKQAIENGVIRGPRMMPCSHELVTLGDGPDGAGRNWHMEIGGRAVIRSFSGPDDIQRIVREEIRQGAEIVKFNASWGHSAGATEERLPLSRTELSTIVETAASRGAKTRAHTASKLSILECARAGVHIIDHADRMDAECIEALLESGSFVVPSMLYIARFLEIMENADRSAAVPLPSALAEFEATLRTAREDFESMCRVLPEANAAGVKLLTGDDFGITFLPHGDYGKELEFYVKQIGIPAQDVIRWATVNGALAMGRGDELGSVTEGKLADLLVVDGDPIADITCLTDRANYRAILKSGSFYRNDL